MGYNARLVAVITPRAAIIIPIILVVRRATVPVRGATIGIGIIFFVEPRRHAAATPACLVTVTPTRRIGAAIPAAALSITVLGESRSCHANPDDERRHQCRAGDLSGHGATSRNHSADRETARTELLFRLTRCAGRADQAGAAVDD